MEVMDLKSSLNTGKYLAIILTDVPKGERSRRNTKDQYSVECPYYDLNNFTKKFCVLKKCWNLWPLNSDQESDLMSCHWFNNFNGIYDKKDIVHPTPNMADNHRQIVFMHHVFKHCAKVFTYFNSDNKKYMLNRVKEFLNTKRNKNEVALKLIRAEEKVIIEAQTK